MPVTVAMTTPAKARIPMTITLGEPEATQKMSTATAARVRRKPRTA